MKIETKDALEVMGRHLGEVESDLNIVETTTVNLHSVLPGDKLISV